MKALSNLSAKVFRIEFLTLFGRLNLMMTFVWLIAGILSLKTEFQFAILKAVIAGELSTPHIAWSYLVFGLAFVVGIISLCIGAFKPQG